MDTDIIMEKDVENLNRIQIPKSAEGFKDFLKSKINMQMNF